MRPPAPRATIAVVGGDARSVAASVASALAQTAPDVEVLLVTTGDAAEAAGASVADGVRRVAALGATLGGALQNALDAAGAPYVLLLRAGELLAPDALARHLDAIEAYPPQAASVARWDADSGAGPADGRGAATPSRGALLRRLLRGASVPLGCALLRRDHALAVGGFDASFAAAAAEDFWLRFLVARPVRALDAALLHGAISAAADTGEDDGDGTRDVRRAEHGRALVRAFRSHAQEALVAATSDGAWVDPAAARLDLARQLLASALPDALPLAHALVAGALRRGGEPPADDAFTVLRARVPELWRRGLPLATRRGGAPAADDEGRGDAGRADGARGDAAAALARERPRGFPPRLVLALDAASLESTGAGALVADARALAGNGIDLLVVASARDGRDASEHAVAHGARVELLQWDAREEAAALLARCAVDALVATREAPLAHVARERGVVVLERVPDADDGRRATALRRAIAAAGATSARAHASAVDAALSRLVAARAEADALRVVAAGLEHPGSVTGRALARAQDLQARDDLAVVAREAESLAALAPVVRLRAVRILDKLRLGHRLGSGVRALGARLGAGATARVERAAALDVAALDAFLAAAERRDGWLWVVYATDPYSETRGQRSTWLTRALARRGHRVVYLYWRWKPTDAILASGDPHVLQVPIDRLASIQARLFRLAAPGLRKVLLAEFPDVALFERADLFAAHGFVTVYDCIDEWAEFARVGQAYWYDAAVERHLARNADVVVATHPLLAAHLAEVSGRDVPLVPNGVEAESLAPPAERPRAPVVVGYFGHLTSSWFDWDLVREAAALRPEWRFEIVGYGQPDGLDVPPNVVLPGMVPHAELSSRTAHWTVGVIPFREGRLTQAVDPVKLYEYLALGMPVVAVGMPHLASVPGVVVCERAGFVDALERALAEPLDRAAVARFVAQSGWTSRADALVALVAAADPSRNLVRALAG